MTEPWMTIKPCPDCGEDQFNLNKLPSASFDAQIPAQGCECAVDFKHPDETEEE